MTDQIDRTPKGATIRKYFPNSCLSDEELHDLAKSYAKIAGIMFVKPSRNKGFGVLVEFAERIKKKHGRLSWNQYRECW